MGKYLHFNFFISIAVYCSRIHLILISSRCSSRWLIDNELQVLAFLSLLLQLELQLSNFLLKLNDVVGVGIGVKMAKEKRQEGWSVMNLFEMFNNNKFATSQFNVDDEM